MKKIIIFPLVAAFILSSALSVNAQENQTASEATQTIIEAEEITIKDLEIENTGILPTNPFYFLKNFRRTIQRVITFDPVKEATLELKILNEQAAEIKKLEEITPDRIEAIYKAAENYNQNSEKLKQRLENLKETSQNPNINELMEKIADKSIKHQLLFDNLAKKFENQEELKNRLQLSQQGIDEIIAKIPQKFDDSKMFKERLERIIEKKPGTALRELRILEILDKVENRLPEIDRNMLEESKEAFIRRFEQKINNLTEKERGEILKPEILKKLPGEPLLRLKIIDEIANRSENNGIKEAVLKIRDKIIEGKIDIKKEEVEKIISETKNLISKIENELTAISINKKPAEESLKVIKTHLINAEKALSENKIGEAFGQATSAYSKATNTLRELIKIKNQSSASTPTFKERDQVCIQVIAPAISPTGICREFPTPCDVPETWKKVAKCPFSTSTSTPTIAEPPLHQLFTVTYENGVFSPKELKIRKGDAVRWINKNPDSVWPASAIHPFHNAYPQKNGCSIIGGSAFDACRALTQGESWDFTFNFVGSWKYHNHLKPSVGGVIVVSE
ncbi:MAG: DUF5667 domain-containing protein [Patescibacteria group bacterium]